jgi:hypothetical protein
LPSYYVVVSPQPDVISICSDDESVLSLDDLDADVLTAHLMQYDAKPAPRNPPDDVSKKHRTTSPPLSASTSATATSATPAGLGQAGQVVDTMLATLGFTNLHDGPIVAMKAALMATLAAAPSASASAAAAAAPSASASAAAAAAPSASASAAAASAAEKAADAGLAEFGLPAYREGQREAVVSLLLNSDVCAWLSTGTGKTLIPLVFSVLKGGIVVVISPLIMLMRGQVQSINSNSSGAGLRAIFLGSHQQDEDLKQRARDGDVDVLFLSPEYAYSWLSQNRDVAKRVSLLCVDEDHCLLEDGKSFRPPYVREVPKIRSELLSPDIPLLGLSATMSVGDAALFSTIMGMENAVTVRGSPDRKDVFIGIRESKNFRTDIMRLLSEYDIACESHGGVCQAIGYFATKKELYRAMDLWNDSSPNKAKAVDGDTPKEEGDLLLAQWLSGEAPVIFATSAFGMGIDCPTVGLVFQMGMPASISQMTQYLGRVARGRSMVGTYVCVAYVRHQNPSHSQQRRVA